MIYTFDHSIDPDNNYTFSRSGLIVPRRLARRPIAIDLFCGAGGFSLGFMQAGFEVVAGLDYDYQCMITYLVNLGNYPVEIHYIEPTDKDKVNDKMEMDVKKKFKKNGGVMRIPVAGSGWISNYPDIPGVPHYFYGDARKITGQEILDAIGLKRGDVDCVMGGPPCQGFSIAGKKDVMDPRNSLVFEFARLVLEIQPKSMCFENVPGILSMFTPEGIPVIDALCRVLEDGGFGGFNALKRGLLETAGCGAALRSSKKPSKDKKRKMEKEKLKEAPGQMTIMC